MKKNLFNKLKNSLFVIIYYKYSFNKKALLKEIIKNQ
jgi:hypothetical protein